MSPIGHTCQVKIKERLSVGTGVFEMKIDYGPGFRIYYGIVDDEIILLLMGGSKRTQQGDIEKAKAYWILWKENSNE
jgi:putative addiction module killer protein